MGLLLVQEAFAVQMPDRSIHSWDRLIGRYVKCIWLGLARQLFDGMPRRNETSGLRMTAGYSRRGKPKEALMLFCLFSTRFLESERWIHAYIRGNIGLGYQFTSAMQGFGGRSVWMFMQMEENGIAPDKVPYIAVLHGCAYSVLIEKALKLFYSMTNMHKMVPDEHHACMVDVLGRAGT
ncbi:hypothetical protein EJ110_NYTH22495 [Nymphaea thermarum]|nr:hypothetical protein EJ110_NYTH22495 [Nymphaea thermarum]